MEPKEQPYDYRWHRPDDAVDPNQRDCMDRGQWPLQARAYNDFTQKFDPRMMDQPREFDPRQIMDATKAFVDHNGKLAVFETVKTFVDDRQSPMMTDSSLIDPAHSATPTPPMSRQPQQQSLQLNQQMSQHSVAIPGNLQQLHGNGSSLPGTLQVVALPPQNQAPSQVQPQQQVLLVIKDMNMVTNGNSMGSSIPVANSNQLVSNGNQPPQQQPKEQAIFEEITCEEPLSPGMILEHAEVDDEETDEEQHSDVDLEEELEPDDQDCLPDAVIEKAEEEVDPNVRRSGRKRRTATYIEDFDLDLEDNDLDPDSPGKRSAERKKRKSSKPVRVTQEPTEASEWTEVEEENESAPARKKPRSSHEVSRQLKPAKTTHVYFGQSKLDRFVSLKQRSGLCTDAALINRMLSLMEKTMDDTDNDHDRGRTAQSTKSRSGSSPFKVGRKPKKFRTTIHEDDEELDEFGVIKSEQDDVKANICLRTTPDIRRCWLELSAQSKMTSSGFLAHLLMLYSKFHDSDQQRNPALLEEEQKNETNKHEVIEICSCEPCPETETETANKEPKAKKKKTKEVEMIDEKDYIVYQVQTPSTNDQQPPRVSKYYQCSYCQKIYKSLNIFYHLRTHKNRNSLCEKCGKQTPIRQPKKTKEPNNCLYCDFKSHYRPVLRNHYKNSHPLQYKPGLYMCDKCPKSFKSASTLRDHRWSHMPPSCQFQCQVCQKYFANRRFLRTHMAGVHGSRNYVCSYENCDKKFNTKNMLQTHVKRVHLKVKRVECTYEGCDRRFYSKCERAQHIRVAHSKTKEFTCTWQGCGKSFRAPYHLQVHMRIHTDEKPLKCPHCDYRARQRNALNWHLRKHGQGPHFDKVVKPSKPRPPKPQKPEESQPVNLLPRAPEDHMAEIPMYTPQFTNFDFQNMQHNPFQGMEALYHPQMPAFPQAIPQPSAHVQMQYQTL